MSEKNGNLMKITGWLLIILILFSGYLISCFEEFNGFFLFVLVAEMLLVIYFIRRFIHAQITISRIVLALIFIYSGFVKGVDPVGTEYRIADYFIAFGSDWAIPLALPLSIVLNAAEFILGVLLLLNVSIRITSWLVFLMMAVFTIVTINDALYDPVPDCGCFGDAIILANWQTLYKNLVIDALLLIVFFSRNRTVRWFTVKIEWAVLVISVVGFVFFEIYNIRHLPIIDFRDWKVGNKMVNEDPLPLKYYLTYRNIETNEEQDYLSPDYPYNDSVWLSQWEFVKQRVIDPNPRLHD
ncbi:MAG: DoxX family protein, partial [Bacteroidales bacterium]|nr:DoxX family protein [Bacteroidales bacterium]